jgi:hypothetical protein
VTNGYSSVFQITEIGVDDATTKLVPFVVTPTGFRFHEPFEVNDENLETFILNDMKTFFIDVDNSSITIVPEVASKFINKIDSKYFASKDSLSGIFLDIFNKMATEFTSAYSGKRNLVSIGFRQREGNFYFLVRTVSNDASFLIPYTMGDNKITINTFDGNKMTNAEMDNNARLFYANTNIPSLKEVLNVMQGSYDLSTEEPFSLNTIKYTKTGNNADYLIVKR